MAISTARQFFDDLVAGGVPAIEALVTNSVHETEWLDFKSGEHLKDTAETWSEAISSFANNQGGVLIWGVDARKDKATGIDAASDVKPVPSPASLRSRLMELLRGAAEPPVIGVEVRDFSRADGAGFVVCLIPESDSKPHRAELLTNKPYKIRIADSFQHLSPSLLRNLFYPRASTSLQIDIFPDWTAIEPGGPVPAKIEVLYLVKIRNTGVITARDLFVVVRTLPYGLKIDLPYGASKVDTHDGHGIDFGRPLHPSSYAQLCLVRQTVGVATMHQGNEPRYVPGVRGFEAEFDVFASDMRPLKLKTGLGDWDIERKNPKTAFHRADEA